MATKQATVSWPDGKSKAKVHPNPIKVKKSEGPTDIEWVLGENVASFQISGLDAAEFAPDRSGSSVTRFTTRDQNDKKKKYTYTVTATHTNGQTDSHDPKIENGAG